jgi:hypothetical protein
VNNFYRAYGLTLASAVVIEALLPEPALGRDPDLVVSSGPRPEWVDRALALPRKSHCPRPSSGADPGFVLTEFDGSRYAQLAYGDGSRFLVNEDATAVWGQSGPDLSTEDFCVYLLGPVLGYVLRRRGRTALHASAFSVDGRAFALCGEAGSGKSTTAASLALRGWPVLCEDVCALAEADKRHYVFPGYPRICLWPDSVNLLFSSPEALPLIVPRGWEKRYLALDGVRGRFAGEPAPLSAIYLLSARSEDPGAPRIEPLSKRHALLQLVQNTYMNWLLGREQRAAEFDSVAKLVSQVACFRALPSADPARLRELAVLIESHATALLSRGAAPAAGPAHSHV